jgi:hypothetical protein
VNFDSPCENQRGCLKSPIMKSTAELYFLCIKLCVTLRLSL